MNNDISFPSSPSPSPSQKEPSKIHTKHRSREISFSELDPALREQLKPNAHPYAIKTTSTGILSRSNSTTSNYQRETRHSYVPSSPVLGSPTRHPRQRPAGQGHRKSSASFSGSESPRPLPTPPLSAVDGIPTTPPPRVRPFPHRTDSFAGVDSHNSFGGDDLSWIRRTAPIAPTSATNSAADLADLPPNPKLWTPSQLSAYLTTALRVRSGVKKKGSVDSFNVEASGDGEDLKLPVRVAQDIAAFVRDKKINGRVFLRWEEGDLENYGINKLWRTALLTASRNLRQNVLRGRIWGFEDESNPGSVSSPSILSPVPSVATTPFSSVRGISGLEEMAADNEEQDDESTPNKNTVNSAKTRRPLPTPGSSPSVSANTSPNAFAVPMQTGSAASSRPNTMSKSGNRHAFVTGTNPSNAGSVRVRGVSGLLDDFSESQFNGGERAINLLGDDEDEDVHARMGSVRFKHTRIPSDHPNFPNGLPTYSSSENSSGSERSSSPENENENANAKANVMDGRQSSSSPSSSPPAVLTKKNRGGRSLRVKAKAKARPSSDMMLGMQVEEGGGERKGTKGRVSLSRMMAGGLDQRASPSPSPTKEHGSFTFTDMSRNSNGRVKGMAESFSFSENGNGEKNGFGKEKLSFGEEGRRSRILEDMKALREIGRVRERSGSSSSVSSTHSRSNSLLGTTSGPLSSTVDEEVFITSPATGVIDLGEEEEPRSPEEGGSGSGQSSPGKRPLPVPPYEYDVATAKLAKPTLPIPTPATATTTTLPTPPPTAGEEPTIEELLAKQDAEGHSGQYDDVGLTDTMKYLGSVDSPGAVGSRPGSGRAKKNRVKSKARAVDDEEAYYSSSSKPGVGVYAWEAEVEDDQDESSFWEGEGRVSARGTGPRKSGIKAKPRTKGRVTVKKVSAQSIPSAEQLKDVLSPMHTGGSTSSGGSGRPLPAPPIHPSLLSSPPATVQPQTQGDLDNDEDSTIAALTQSINQTKNMLAKLGDRLQDVEKKVEEEEKELEQAVKKRNEMQSTTPAKDSFLQRLLNGVLGKILPSTFPLSSSPSDPPSSSTASTPSQPQPQTPTTRQTPESLIHRLLISSTHLPARYHAHLAHLLDPQTFSLTSVAPYVVLMSLGMWIVVWRLFGVGWEGLGRNVWRKVAGVGGVPIPFR